MKKKENNGTQTLSTVFQLTVADDKYKKVINDIKLVRYIKWHVGSLYFVMNYAGAKIEEKDGDLRVLVDRKSLPGAQEGKIIVDKSSADLIKSLVNKEMSTDEDGNLSMVADQEYIKWLKSVVKNIYGVSASGPRDNSKLVVSSNHVTYLLETVFKHKEGQDIYSSRRYVLDMLNKYSNGKGWCTAVGDDIRADIKSLWYAKDPSIAKCTRMFLAFQGKRNPPLFRFQGIKFNANVPKKFDNNSITLSWNNDLGPVEFRILGSKQKDGSRKLDKSRWLLWKGICEGRIKHGTICLNERDGKLMLNVPYSVPISANVNDKKTVLEAAFVNNVNNFIQCSVRQGDGRDEMVTMIDQMRNEQLSCSEALAGIDRLSEQSEKLDLRRRACNGIGKACRAATERLNRVTQQRQSVSNYWCHKWSRVIIDTAIRWKCGTIRVFDVPEKLINGRVIGHLFDRSWPWSNFRLKLGYKAKLAGINLVWSGSGSVDKVGEVLLPGVEEPVVAS